MFIGTIKELKPKLFPIQGHPMRTGTTAEKKLYTSMLYAVARIDAVKEDIGIKKHELNFIMSLAAGWVEDDTHWDYQQQLIDAVSSKTDISKDMLKEFSAQFTNSILKYNFIVDSIILARMDGKLNDAEYEVIAGIAEIINITNEEIAFLSQLALIVLEEDGEDFIKLTKDVPINIRLDNFKYYLSRFTMVVLEDKYIKGNEFWTGKLQINHHIINDGSIIIKDALIRFGKDGKITTSNKAVMQIENCAMVNAELIFHDANDIRILNALFRDCADKRALSFNRCSRVVVDNTTFQGCHAPDRYNGGAVFINNSDVSLTECIFNNCVSRASGGAVYVSSRGIAAGAVSAACATGSDGINHSLMYNLEFNNCISEGPGGAVCIEIQSDAGSISQQYPEQYLVKKSIFSNCRSNTLGGAFYKNISSNTCIELCEFNACSVFSNNSMLGSGGAIYIENGNCTDSVSKCWFNDCRARNYGGAICIARYQHYHSDWCDQHVFNNCLSDSIDQCCYPTDESEGLIF